MKTSDLIVMTPEKVAAVKALSAAIHLGTESGLFDYEMWNYILPDHINEFCDAVAALERETLT